MYIYSSPLQCEYAESKGKHQTVQFKKSRDSVMLSGVAKNLQHLKTNTQLMIRSQLNGTTRSQVKEMTMSWLKETTTSHLKGPTEVSAVYLEGDSWWKKRHMLNLGSPPGVDSKEQSRVSCMLLYNCNLPQAVAITW